VPLLGHRRTLLLRVLLLPVVAGPRVRLKARRHAGACRCRRRLAAVVVLAVVEAPTGKAKRRARGVCCCCCWPSRPGGGASPPPPPEPSSPPPPEPCLGVTSTLVTNSAMELLSSKPGRTARAAAGRAGLAALCAAGDVAIGGGRRAARL